MAHRFDNISAQASTVSGGAAALRPTAPAALLRRLGVYVALVATFAWSGLAAPLSAQDSGSGIELDEVEVTATRIPERAADAPQAVWVVTAGDIAARGAATVADAVRVAAGVALADYGPEGSQKSVSLRGSTTNQVLVLVDGRRVNDAFSGLVDLSNVPADRIERIEVMRGSGSALYGGDAVGGVINVITKGGAAPLVLRLENGSYIPESRVLDFGFNKKETDADFLDLVDTQRLSVSAAPALGDAIVRFGGSFTRAANAYTYTDANSERRGLQNAGFVGGDASVGVGLPFLAGKLSADLAGNYSEKGVPGTMSDPTPNASQADAGASLAARYAAETSFSELASIDASFRAAWSRIDYSDADTPANDGLHDIGTATFDVAQRYLASDSLAVAYGTSTSYTRAWSDTVGERERWTAAAFAEPAFGSGALSFRPSLRYDWYSDFSPNEPLSGLAGQFGVAYKLARGKALKLSLSRAYRVPTFQDLYWPAAAGVEGNPDLVPESAYEANFAYELREKSLSYTASAYVRYSRDVILWQPGDDGVWRPSNYGAALYPGIEQELRADLGGGYSLAANYSYLRSYGLSGGLSFADNKRLPMTPVHTLNGTIAYAAERFSWSTTARYVGKRYLKLANAAFLPAYFTLDAAAKWKASKRYAAYIAADNLFDEEYEVVDGYPMPGTRIRIGLELTLD
jgi:vitamin B12 transporter